MAIKFLKHWGCDVIAFSSNPSKKDEILSMGANKVINSKENIGAKASFGILLEYAIQNTNSEYLMFCDQDDYWLPTKVSETLNKIANKDQAEPMAVFTDLYVTNSELEILSDSMLKNDQKMKPSYLLKKPLILMVN